MSEPLVINIRSVELGVTDLERSLAFYTEAWGLEWISSEGLTHHLRARGPEHHVLSLTRTSVAGLIGVDFEARDERAVATIADHEALTAVCQVSRPFEANEAAGGGLKVEISGAEGLRIGVSAGVARHPELPDDPSRPVKLTHVVVNTAQIEVQRRLFRDVLGFRLSDSTQRMDFFRSGRDHHSLALAPGEGLSLNHAAFEMDHIDGQMYGSGRVVAKGFPLEWGVGRHGPGSNVFCYFLDPDGMAVEYTTEVDQVDDLTHVPRTPEYWAAFPNRPCRWGIATKPSPRLVEAFAGHGLAHAT